MNAQRNQRNSAILARVTRAAKNSDHREAWAADWLNYGDATTISRNLLKTLPEVVCELSTGTANHHNHAV